MHIDESVTVQTTLNDVDTSDKVEENEGKIEKIQKDKESGPSTKVSHNFSEIKLISIFLKLILLNQIHFSTF